MAATPLNGKKIEASILAHTDAKQRPAYDAIAVGNAPAIGQRRLVPRSAGSIRFPYGENPGF